MYEYQCVGTINIYYYHLLFECFFAYFFILKCSGSNSKVFFVIKSGEKMLIQKIIYVRRKFSFYNFLKFISLYHLYKSPPWPCS
uniref:Uncharacterized protein n=1 Tax=Anguilla anguilla TaxID=7936 RepID=A0A0E9RXW2_ANGAN